MQYCSLKEAFPGIPEKEKRVIEDFIRPNYLTSPPPVNSTVFQKDYIKENFSPEQPDETSVTTTTTTTPPNKELSTVKSCPECEKRKNKKFINTTFNEILNIILIMILLYIVIYKPSI